jgi:hypothetical protein
MSKKEEGKKKWKERKRKKKKKKWKKGGGRTLRLYVLLFPVFIPSFSFPLAKP